MQWARARCVVSAHHCRTVHHPSTALPARSPHLPSRAGAGGLP
jgi:hypothetical protein